MADFDHHPYKDVDISAPSFDSPGQQFLVMKPCDMGVEVSKALNAKDVPARDLTSSELTSANMMAELIKDYQKHQKEHDYNAGDKDIAGIRNVLSTDDYKTNEALMYQANKALAASNVKIAQSHDQIWLGTRPSETEKFTSQRLVKGNLDDTPGCFTFE